MESQIFSHLILECQTYSQFGSNVLKFQGIVYFEQRRQTTEFWNAFFQWEEPGTTIRSFKLTSSFNLKIYSSCNLEDLWETEGCSGWRNRLGFWSSDKELWQKLVFVTRAFSPFHHPADYNMSEFCIKGNIITSFLFHIRFTNLTIQALWLKSWGLLAQKQNKFFLLSLCSQSQAYLLGLLEPAASAIRCSTWTQR